MKENQIKKVLIFRLGAIGDVVHSTELFRSIKRYRPDIEIHYLTFKIPALLLENDPDINKLWIGEGKSYKKLFKIAKELRKEKFDLCINLQPSSRTKFLSLIIGAKKNITYKKTFELHAVENFWRTGKTIFKEITLNDEIRLYIANKINQKISNFLQGNKKLVSFNIGTTATRQGRKWPIEYWQNLAIKLLEKYDCEIILSGSNEEKEMAKELVSISPLIKSFCGELNIAESAAMLGKCAIVISSDTGPLHIATALGVPTIGIYGAAPISRTGPYGKLANTVKSEKKCVPCNKRKCKYLKKGEIYTPCILDIKPDKVFKVIEELNLLNKRNH